MNSREETLTGGTQWELVAIALYVLGGPEALVDTEDVAVQVHKLAPDRFSWRKYPEQINLELVRVALSDAKKPEQGALVAGTGKTGWSLTVAGRRWAESHADRLIGSDLSRPRGVRQSGSIDERRWQRERVRVLSSDAWTEWKSAPSGGPISPKAAADLFRIDRYVTGRSREIKVNRLVELFRDDEDVMPLLDAASKTLLQER